MGKIRPSTGLARADRVFERMLSRISALERRPAAERIITPSTTLPTSPFVGQRAVVPHTTGWWELVWTGAEWAFTGGADLVAYTLAEVSTSSSAYPASPQGPSVTPPIAGTYEVYLEARHRHSHSGDLFTAMIAREGSTSKGQEIAPIVDPGDRAWVTSWSSEAAGVSLGTGGVGMGFRSPNSLATHYGNRQIRIRPRSFPGS